MDLILNVSSTADLRRRLEDLRRLEDELRVFIVCFVVRDDRMRMFTMSVEKSYEKKINFRSVPAPTLLALRD